MKRLKIIVFGGALAYLAVASFLYFTQRQILYFPPKIYVTPQAAGVDMEEVTVKVETDITFWYRAPQNERAPVIMFFHGNGSALYSNSHIFKDLIADGYGVLSVGYVGYPGSDGKPAQNRIVQAAKFQREWLAGKGISDDRIVYFGTSIGSGVAAQLTALKPPVLLIMDAPFNSTLDMAKMRVPFLPHSILMKDQFRSDVALKTYNGPMIWMHGTADRIVPISQGQKLYDGYDGPKSSHIFEGGHHSNLWGLGARDVVLSRLREAFPSLPNDEVEIKNGKD